MVHLATIPHPDESEKGILKEIKKAHLQLANDEDCFTTSVYGSKFAALDLPKHEMPEQEMPKEVAYRSKQLWKPLPPVASILQPPRKRRRTYIWDPTRETSRKQHQVSLDCHEKRRLLTVDIIVIKDELSLDGNPMLKYVSDTQTI